MSRLINDPNNLIQKAISSDHLNLAILVYLDFISGPNGLMPGSKYYTTEMVPPDTRFPVKLTNAGMDIEWEGSSDENGTYRGIAGVGEINPYTETSENVAQTIMMRLNGIPSEIAQLSFEDRYLGRPAKVYVALLDEDNNLVNEPQLIFDGGMDTMNIVHSGNIATIELECTSKFSEWERIRGGRYNAEYQDKLINKYKLQNRIQNVGSNWRDKAFDFIPSLLEKDIKWGQTNSGGSSGGFGNRSRISQQVN